MKPVKNILRFIRRFKFVFIGIVILAILVGAYFPARIFYKDHNPPINLIKMGSIGIETINGSKSTKYFRVPDNWQVSYAYDCSGNINNDVFQIGITSTNSSVSSVLSSSNTNGGFLTKNAIGEGVQTIPNKGVYSLTVLTDANCNWTMIVATNQDNQQSASFSRSSQYIVQANSKAVENMILGN